MNHTYAITGQLVDIHKQEIYPAEIFVESGRIHKITRLEDAPDRYIMPGLVDSHVHIESSLLIPSQFASLVVRHGTLAVVTDPHEIANVLGEIGVDFMINDAKKVPMEIRFGVPSCVPATSFETSGFVLDSNIVESLLHRDEVVCLAEVMDFPGVVNGKKEVYDKIEAATLLGKRIDGHAPGLKGEDLKKYVAAGISADHECSGIDEALEKIKLGMLIQIREGSAAKDFDALCPLIGDYSDKIMLCTDDTHPDELLENGHINALLRKGISKGVDLFKLIKTATINPVNHYGLELGLLQEGDSADFIVVENLIDFEVLETYYKGEAIYSGNKVSFQGQDNIKLNNFSRKPICKEQLNVIAKSDKMRIILASDGDLLTETEICEPKLDGNLAVSDIENDILKIVVLSRYDNSAPSIGFIKGFGLKKGALAESIAHDSHNIVAIGANDSDLLKAINKIIDIEGGMVAADKVDCVSLNLEVAGLMSNKPAEIVVNEYLALQAKSKEYGTSFKAPFMTLGFMPLLVIPKLKISDKGLFDVTKFKLVDLFL